MKTIIVTIFMLLHFGLSANSNEKPVKSTIHQVTVFEKGAQVLRSGSTKIPAGNSIIKFVDIAPHILSNSIQVKGIGDFTILSVKYHQNYLNKNTISQELETNKSKRDSLTKMIEDRQTFLVVLKEEYSLITSNKSIGGNDGVKLDELKATAQFYQTRLKDIKLEELSINREIKALNKNLQDLVKQEQNLSRSFKDYTSEIIVSIESKNEVTGNFTLSYLVQNAGWFANYDARVKDVNSPVELMYKGKIYQTSGEDWDNVSLTLSTGNPQENATKPTMSPWWIDYQGSSYRRQSYSPGVYSGLAWDGLNRTITGVITDTSGQPMIGASVVIYGTSVGVITDIDGRYSIQVPQGGSRLIVSYVGYNNLDTPIISNNMSLVLNENSMALNEVVVTGYGGKRLKNSLGQLKSTVAGLAEKEESKDINITEVENTTSVEFKIKNPYTIPSDGQQYTVRMIEHELKADYEYYCAPKINDDAFLTAEITDWKDLHLKTGELNIFFKDTYLGKSMLDANNISDTLSLSLGVDKDIVVQRNKIKDYSKRRIIGLKKVVSRSWDIEVLNKKNQDIKIIIEDQFPLSTNEDIVVDKINYKGATHDEETGSLIWSYDLKAGESNKSNFAYSVKYNKRKYIPLE